MSSLAAWFINGLGEGLGERASDPDDLALWEAALRSRLAEAQAAWPEVRVAPDAFARCVGEKVAEHSGDRRATLSRLATRDLYLAQACATGDSVAIAILHDRLLPQVVPALRHLGADASAIADVTQHMLEILLVGDEQRGPRIAGYGGRGDLTSWLRSVAVRTALKLMSRDRRGAHVSDDDLDGVLLADDAELNHLKQRYAAEVSAALREAVGALSVRQRMLLRLHYVDGLTVEQLGRMYRVHKATAARWVAAAREALFEETRLRVQAAGVAETELHSVVRLVQSQIHLSITRLLNE